MVFGFESFLGRFLGCLWSFLVCMSILFGVGGPFVLLGLFGLGFWFFLLVFVFIFWSVVLCLGSGMGVCGLCFCVFGLVSVVSFLVLFGVYLCDLVLCQSWSIVALSTPTLWRAKSSLCFVCCC